MGSLAYTKTTHITWENVISTLLKTEKDDYRKKILVLSTYSCYPPRGGGQQRLFNIYSRLAKKFDITICSIVDSNKLYECLLLENGLQQISIPQSMEHAQFNGMKRKNWEKICMIVV